MTFAKTNLASISSFMNPPAKKNEAYHPTHQEKVANCFTHGVFVFPAAAGLVLLLLSGKTLMHNFVAWLYGLSMIALFLISTSFHVLCLTSKFGALRWYLHLGDRIVIYTFIAASYMPWLLLQDVGPIGEFVTWLLWSAVASGTIFSFFFYEKYKMLETLLYLILGICPSFSLFYVRESKALVELVCGGVFYVGGVAFYKADGRIPFAHAIWHLFVVCGAACHFYAVATHLYN